MRYFYIVFSLFLFSCKSAIEDKTVRSISDGAILKKETKVKAWDNSQQKWLFIEDFWLAYAERNGGLTWGKGTQYPAYEQVEEFDTFLVQVKQGNCLMEFFHSRWRRANDVRRWDDKHNEYGGCPYVFE